MQYPLISAAPDAVVLMPVAAIEISLATQEYRKRINAEVARLSGRHQLDRKLANFVDSELMKQFSPHREHKFRCTIHIADPVHDERLYQLLDYYPSGTGAFRPFPERYGIIGKVWRAEKSQIERNLLRDVPSNAPHEEKITKIMQDWGMTRREAEASVKRPSYFCFLLQHDGSKVGLVYMDSERSEAFNETLANDVELLARTELAPSVSKLLNDLASVTLRIELRDY